MCYDIEETCELITNYRASFCYQMIRRMIPNLGFKEHRPAKFRPPEFPPTICNIY